MIPTSFPNDHGWMVIGTTMAGQTPTEETRKRRRAEVNFFIGRNFFFQRAPSCDQPAAMTKGAATRPSAREFFHWFHALTVLKFRVSLLCFCGCKSFMDILPNIAKFTNNGPGLFPLTLLGIYCMFMECIFLSWRVATRTVNMIIVHSKHSTVLMFSCYPPWLDAWVGHQASLSRPFFVYSGVIVVMIFCPRTLWTGSIISPCPPFKKDSPRVTMAYHG